MSDTQLINSRVNNLRVLLDKSKKEIAMALPRHLTPDRMLRIAATEVRRNPKLADCTPASFIGAVIQAAQLGLEPGSALGHAYLIPFNNRKTKQSEVQLIIGYRGFVDLASRSDRVSHVIARTVYEKDEFRYSFGTKEEIHHVGSTEADRGAPTHYYAVIHLKSGGAIFEVATDQEMKQFRKELNPLDSSPWFSHFEEMAKKSLVRRLFKYSPSSIEIQRAVSFDEAGERGEQDNASAIDLPPMVDEKEAARELLRQEPKEELKGQTNETNNK